MVLVVSLTSYDASSFISDYWHAISYYCVVWNDIFQKATSALYFCSHGEYGKTKQWLCYDTGKVKNNINLKLYVNVDFQLSLNCYYQVLSTLSIAYLAYCTYSTIFKIKLLNIYYLAPNHQTTESSLIFFGL
jgi:hypothetical protein